MSADVLKQNDSADDFAAMENDLVLKMCGKNNCPVTRARLVAEAAENKKTLGAYVTSFANDVSSAFVFALKHW